MDSDSCDGPTAFSETHARKKTRLGATVKETKIKVSDLPKSKVGYIGVGRPSTGIEKLAGRCPTPEELDKLGLLKIVWDGM